MLIFRTETEPAGINPVVCQKADFIVVGRDGEEDCVYFPMKGETVGIILKHPLTHENCDRIRRMFMDLMERVGLVILRSIIAWDEAVNIGVLMASGWVNDGVWRMLAQRDGVWVDGIILTFDGKEHDDGKLLRESEAEDETEAGASADAQSDERSATHTGRKDAAHEDADDGAESDDLWPV
jgi:hypothetical protein